MTSEQNKKLPILKRKKVIGIDRRPNRRDLYDRKDPDGKAPLQVLPDPDPDVVLRRAAFDVGVAAVRMQDTIREMNPVSALRESLIRLPDPAEREIELDEDERRLLEDELIAEVSDMDPKAMADALAEALDDDEEREMEDGFIAKASGVEVGEVTAARARRAPVLTNMQRFVMKVRAVKQREADVITAAAAAARVLTNLQPGMTRELTVAEAALVLTNKQVGTKVTMEDLRTSDERKHLEDSKETYRWTVGSVDTRNLTVAEAALVLTNMQAGTNVTMQDLRTARDMVDLWDNEDTFQWTVGNVS